MGFPVPLPPPLEHHHYPAYAPPVGRNYPRRYRPCIYCCFHPPPPSSPPPTLNFIVYPRNRRRLPYYRCPFHPRPTYSSSTALIALLSYLLFSSAIIAFALWPSDPVLSLTPPRLHHFRVSSLPSASIDIAMGFKIGIGNPSIFEIDYSSLVASIFYRGERLCSVESAGGHIDGLFESYVDAYLHVGGDKVLEDNVCLIGDIARGSVQFNIVTETRGWLRLYFFDVPVKGRTSCIVDANPADQTIIHQDCYPVDRDLEYFRSYLSPDMIGRVSSWLRTKLHRGAER